MRQRITEVDGLPIVSRESDAYAVYDVDAREIVALAPGVMWPIRKSKWLRENGTGHRCVYVGFPYVGFPYVGFPTGDRV